MGLFRRGRASGRSLAQGLMDAFSARRLAHAAGLARRPALEQLEDRRLLFSLSVTADDVDPATGLGTVRAYFGYVLPYLNTNFELDDDQEPTILSEDFNDNAYANIVSGSFFSPPGQTVAIQARHNIAPASDFRIAAFPDNNDANNQERFLRASLTDVTEFFEFRLRSGTPPGDLPSSAQAVSFLIAGINPIDATGLDTDNIRVSLIRNIADTTSTVASFTGQALRDLLIGGNAGAGTGTFTVNQGDLPQGVAGFDTVRVELIDTYTLGGDPAFRLDDLAFTQVSGDVAGLYTGRLVGAVGVLSGPVGATASFFDLYGRPLVRTIVVGAPQGQTLPQVDTLGTGIPDFNDGIGSIAFSGVDGRTSFTLWGGDLQAAQEPPDDADFFEGGIAFTIEDSLQGNFDDLEGAGFAYGLDVSDDGDFTFTGLPPGSGSVVVGSPFVRPQNNYNPFGGAAPGLVTQGFNRSDQGLFVQNGQSMGRVNIHGILHGSSLFTGYVNEIWVGYLVGSVSVEGDLGALMTATDSGMWAPDPDFEFTDPGLQIEDAIKTNAQVVVGRTLGEFASAGRSLMDVTVFGDLESPTTRPARDTTNYFEKEFVTGITAGDLRDLIRRNLYDANNVYAQSSTQLFRNFWQQTVFGASYYRNSTLNSSEWVGSISGSVRISGDLSGVDIPQAEDRADVYAFAVDGTGEVAIQAVNAQTGFGQYFRIVDSAGRTLAAPQSPFDRSDRRRFASASAVFKPVDGPGVYYLVVHDPNGNDDGSNFTSYNVVMTGLAPTTLGSYRTGGGSGVVSTNTLATNSVTVLFGSIGALRVGMGVGGPDGNDADPTANYNLDADITQDDSLSFQGGTFTTPDNLYGFLAGGDVGPPDNNTANRIDVRIGGNLGTILTGISTQVGGNVNQGDLNNTVFTVGGSVGRVLISGGIGMDQDNENDPRGLTGSGVVFRTGTAGGKGDIGLLRVGFHVGGDQLSITTSPGSTIGALLVSQDVYEDIDGRSGVYNGSRGIELDTGAGSDVRFVDFPRVDLQGATDVTTALLGGTTAEFIDDQGARVFFTVDGIDSSVQVGQVRVAPVDDSVGVAVAQVIVDLTGGLTLRIHGTSATVSGLVSLGRLVITGDAASSVRIDGNVEIDVYRLEISGAVGSIENLTPRGDILALDANAVGTIRVDGDLGRTQVNAWGPTTYAPIIGLTGDGGGAATRAPLGWVQSTALIDNDFNGTVYRPINDDNFVSGAASMDDLGAIFDDRLDGAVIRTGSVVSVDVGGKLGDLILIDGGGALLDVRINHDNTIGINTFDGLEGTIFAFIVGTVRVGDGVASRSDNPMSSPGVYASNNIDTVVGGTGRSNFRFGGAVGAGNLVGGDVFEAADGINVIEVTNAQIRDGVFTTGQLDQFWSSFIFAEEVTTSGDIGAMRLTNSTLFRSFINTRDLNNLDLSGGFYDASVTFVRGRADTIQARGFRNSTLTGDEIEFRSSLIVGSDDIARISATDDILDLVLDVTGEITSGISARNIVRGNFGVDNRLADISTRNDVRSTLIQTGRLQRMSVGGDLASSTITSNLIEDLRVTGDIRNSALQATGAGGEVRQVTVGGSFTGQVLSSGKIRTVRTTSGDLIVQVSTSGPDGDVELLSAGRDADITGEISGTLSNLTAGRHLGSQTDPGLLLVRGNVTSISAPAGQLYNDISSGGTINSVVLGGASDKPGSNRVGTGSLVASNRIVTVRAGGDFGGSIISHTGGISSVRITNGSFLPGGLIAAYDGDLSELVITSGSLLGNVHADNDIVTLRVEADLGGVFGDIGINPDSSQFIPFDALRNQLPEGVQATPGIQSAYITAGRDIRSVVLTGGDIYESVLTAGRTFNTLSVSGRVANNADFGTKGSLIAAGDRIVNLTVTGSIADAYVIAGLTGLGSDNIAGGVGTGADIIKSGEISTVNVSGGTFGVTFVAGADAGGNGIYGEPASSNDDTLSLGLSLVNALNISGTVSNTAVVGDTLSDSVRADTRFSVKKEFLPLTSFTLDDGSSPAGIAFSGTQSFAVGSATYTLTFSGPGQAFFQLTGVPATGLPASLVTLRNTGSTSSLTVRSSTGLVENMGVLSNDDATLGTLRVDARYGGASQVLIDGGISTIDVNETILGRTSTGAVDAASTPSFTTGGDVSTATFGIFGGGFVTTRVLSTFRVHSGDFGSPDFGDAQVQALSGTSVNIAGASRGVFSYDRDLSTLTVTGSSARMRLRVGGSLTTLSTGALSESVIGVGHRLNSMTVRGESFDTSIVAGVDLGRDAAFEGTGQNADTIFSGSIGSANIQGDFRESDLIAGLVRGTDRFFGTGDDRIGGGRGSIGTVTIQGTRVGSTRGSESYRIEASGSIGSVTLAGVPFTGSQGNFAVVAPNLAPESIDVQEIVVTVEARSFFADVVFNQPMDASTLSPSLSIAEVRGTGDIEVRLIEGVDYTLQYVDSLNTLRVRFSQTITTANLPQVPGIPGPGVYRFRFDQDVTRARLQTARFQGGDFVDDTFIGDVGDKLVAERVTLSNGAIVDLYGPADLDIALDSSSNPDGVPDANRPITIRGSIGDHPDHDITQFRFAGDVDLYKVTLQAGQIIRLTQLSGAAAGAAVTLLDSSGNALSVVGATAIAVSLPVPVVGRADVSFPQQYLIKQTGTYFVAVGDTAVVAEQGVVNNPDAIPGGTGTYELTVEIFDDGDTGFTASTGSGDGQGVVPAPDPIAFAGVDGVFGTGDDIPEIIIDAYTFRLEGGASGTVVGTNGQGGVSTRLPSGQRTWTFDSTIGSPGDRGVPGTLDADIDVYHLENRSLITPGTRYRVTLRLTEQGSNLGSQISFASLNTLEGGYPPDNLRGSVQLGLFDTSASTQLDDAALVFSPSDFLPFGGAPNTIIADNGTTSYGYDSSGDFFIQFATPQRLDAPGASGTFAVYIQGVFNANYQLQIENLGSGSTPAKVTQNFLLETQGGSVNWLEAGGFVTDLLPFDVTQLGFTGTLAGGQQVGTYVLTNLAAALNSLFQSAGLAVNFSTDPSDFEFEPFSTIYLSNAIDPINPIYDSFSGFNVDFFSSDLGANQAFFASQPYGVAQHVDPFNADLEDEAVVFLPAFLLLGLSPSQLDVDQFVQAATGAVARRAGELMGARTSESNVLFGVVPNTFDPFASDAVIAAPQSPTTFTIPENDRGLSNPFDSVQDTDFFLGRQRAASLLRMVAGT